MSSHGGFLRVASCMQPLATGNREKQIAFLGIITAIAIHGLNINQESSTASLPSTSFLVSSVLRGVDTIGRVVEPRRDGDKQQHRMTLKGNSNRTW